MSRHCHNVSCQKPIVDHLHFCNACYAKMPVPVRRFYHEVTANPRGIKRHPDAIEAVAVCIARWLDWLDVPEEDRPNVFCDVVVGELQRVYQKL